MKASRRQIRHAFLLSATTVTAAAMIVAGVISSAVSAQPVRHTIPSQIGPGYPPPGGIYKPFTNCPLLNPLMQESVRASATGCIAGDAVTGLIKIGNITTPVAHPVTAQFGLWDPPNAVLGGVNTGGLQQFAGGVLPPLAGVSAQLVTSPEFVPGGLLQALGCPSSNRIVENLCQEAQNFGGRYLDVHALAQSAGQITNFGLTSWTQPVKFRLINPLLGNNCFIGSDDNPVVINPSLTGNVTITPDPNPTEHPDTVVFQISQATAADNTFAAPGVTGCGPGGSANIAVDKAIDSSTGLPAASGVNSLTLNGNFYFAECFNATHQAKILLSAFEASVGTATNGRPQSVRRVSVVSLRGRYGIK
jgi:hypothetical protein